MSRFNISAGFAYQLLNTRLRMLVTWFVISAVLSTIIFIKVNYEPYYLTKGIEYEREAKRLCKSIKIMSDSLVGTENSALKVMDTAKELILLSSSFVEISLNDEVRIDNGKKLSVDKERSLVTYEFAFTNPIGSFTISTVKSNKPKIKDHLWRAWTWSIQEFIQDKEGYLKYKSYQRSEFLYKTLAVIGVFVFFMLTLLKSKHEENIFLNAQLEKEGYYIRKEYDMLHNEIEELIAGGVSCDGDLIMDRKQKLKDLEFELTSIEKKTNVNLLNAKMEYFEPNCAYDIDEIKEKLCISTIAQSSNISIISYSDRYFQRESHIKFFIELLGLKNMNPDHLKSIKISVPVLTGQDREQKEKQIRNKFRNHLPSDLYDRLKIDVHNIHDKAYLHMRVLDIVGGTNKLTLTLDKGMDSLEPHQDDETKYATSTRTYAVVGYHC